MKIHRYFKQEDLVKQSYDQRPVHWNVFKITLSTTHQNNYL